MLNIVLHQPEIHQNTGNIARTCAAVNSRLHLIRPLGFDISDRALKRAGLDYWYLLDVRIYDSMADFFEKAAPRRFWLYTTKAERVYTDVAYEDEDYLVFGRESAGLPEPFLEANRDHCVRIPMSSEARSLNLSNSAAIAVYEAMRQLDFASLNPFGMMKSQVLTRPY